MAKPKFDYDGDAFYKRIFDLAVQGMTDAEIAVNLSEKEGGSLSREMFTQMKNGKYNGWNAEENERRSARISNVLADARHRINGIIRGAYLKSALGGKRIRSVTKRFVQARCDCEGNDAECPTCGGTGWRTLTDKAIIQETENELAPNMQALATWLYHHDPEWRSIQRGVEKVEEDFITDAPAGVDIEAWINREIQENAKMENERKDSDG